MEFAELRETMHPRDEHVFWGGVMKNFVRSVPFDELFATASEPAARMPRWRGSSMTSWMNSGSLRRLTPGMVPVGRLERLV